MSLNSIMTVELRWVGGKFKAAHHVSVIQGLKLKWRASASLSVKFVKDVRIIRD